MTASPKQEINTRHQKKFSKINYLSKIKEALSTVKKVKELIKIPRKESP